MKAELVGCCDGAYGTFFKCSVGSTACALLHLQ